MRYLITTALLALLLTVGISATLAEEIIDPDADLTETLTSGRYSLRYPQGLTTDFNQNQLLVRLSDVSREQHIIITPLSLEEFDTPRDTVLATANAVYDMFVSSFADYTHLQDTPEPIELGDDEAYFFIGTRHERIMMAYIFMVNGEIFVAMLTSDAPETTVQIQKVLTERILATITVDGVGIMSADTPLTDERLAPLDAIAEVELTQVARNPFGAVLTLQLPADWVYQDGGGIFSFASSQVILDQLTAETPQLGDDVLLQIIAFDTRTTERFSEANTTIEEAVEAGLIILTSVADVHSILRYTNLEIQVEVWLGQGTEYDDFEFFLLVFEMVNTGEVVGFVGVGDYATHEAEILAIILSARYEE